MVQLFPSTRSKLKGQGHKVLAALTLGSFAGFAALFQSFFNGVKDSGDAALVLNTGYLFVLFIFAMLAVAASHLGVAKTLFNDFASWPSYVHWLLITIFSSLVLYYLLKAVFIIIINLFDKIWTNQRQTRHP